MLSRRAFQTQGSVAFWQLCATRTLHAAPSRELFTLSRSTNANVVKYAVRVDNRGRLEPARPIEAHWLMLAEDGRREELTWTERQLAYGFRVSCVSREGCRLHLAACAERALDVHLVDGSFRAELEIGKRPAYLQRVFVRVLDNALLPSVRYVEISGVTSSGQPASERLENVTIRR